MKKYIKHILIFIGAIFSSNLWAQQAPHYTQFMYNMNMVNPAYAGIKNGLSLGFLYRNQWMGGDKNPQTYTFNIHSRLGEAMGLGLSAFQDNYGPVNQMHAKLDYSYTIALNSNLNLAFGIDLGLMRTGVDLPGLIAVDPGDPLLTKNINSMKLGYGAGLFLYNEKFYISLSAPNLNTTSYDLQNTQWDQGNAIHYFLAGGYIFDINKDIKLKPHFMLYQAIGSPFALSLNTNVFLYDKLELGVSYRLNDSFSGLINYLLTENLRIGYAYDRSLSGIKLFSPNSHEVFLNYTLPYKHKSFMSPLYF